VLQKRIWVIIFWCLAGVPRLLAQQGPATDRAQVFYGGEPGLVNGYAVDGPAVEALTDQLVMAATGQHSVEAAWRSLVSPRDHVGIKISAAGGRYCSTHRPIVDAVLRGLAEAGVPESQVVVWDRTPPEEAGYEAAENGPALRSVEPFTGYDPRSAITIQTLGKLIWGDVEFRPHGNNPLAPVARNQYSLRSHWSRITSGLTKIINIPVMTASENCGVAGCIYNVTIPNVDNWRRFVAEPECGDPYLCELYAEPHVGPKVVLNIMDGLIAQYGGGPQWQPRYSWGYGMIYAGKDAVAIDSTALRVMEKWRVEAKLPPLTPRAKYLSTAQAMGLGVYDADAIDLVKEGK
jgi:uncharacterized protein (DUF362 family)